jgi:putative transcriptional regulator
MKNSIKVERARNNITQAGLADKVKVSRQTINAIETGKFIPSTLLAFKIAHVLQVTVDVVFQLEESDW